MASNKRLIAAGAVAGGGAFDPLQNFETVTYTGNGSTQKITGYIRKGAAFNGSSSYVENSDIPNQICKGYYTINLWAYIPFSQSYKTVAHFQDDNNNHLPICNISINGSNWYIDVRSNSSGILTSTNIPITFNSWSMVTVVLHSGGARFYINGVEKASASFTPVFTTNTSCKFSLGRTSQTWTSFFGYYLNGQIDQVRIFNTALNQTQIGELALETYADPKKSTTDYFGDGSGVALYELDDSANDTGGTNVVFTTWDSTLSPIPNYSENNLRMTGGSINVMGYSKDIITSGKWYWEHEVISIGGESSFGIARPNDLGSHYVVGTSSTSWGLYVNGNLYHNSSITQSGYMSGGFSNGDIIGVEFDLDNGTIEFYKNGVGYGNAFTGLTGEFIVAAESRTSGGINDHRTNFGQFAWDYTPSTGFIGIPSKYNGTATNVNYLGMAFQPDLVWVKSRGAIGSHIWTDSIRGDGKEIYSDLTNAEGIVNRIALDSNGFTVTSSAYPNQSGNTFVAWCWKAADTTTTIPAGTVGNTIASDVRANTEAGFSIVKWNGYQSSGTKIAHGLNNPPELIISKNLSQTTHWMVVSNQLTSYINVDNETFELPTTAIKRLALNLTIPEDNYGLDYQFGGTTLGGINDKMISYCFHSVPGYQKVGSYPGSTTAVSVTTSVDGDAGFQPRFVLVKGTTEASNWTLWDNIRGGSVFLQPNNSGAEASGRTLVFNSDGFTVNTDAGVNGNNNGQTYIYLAIA